MDLSALLNQVKYQLFTFLLVCTQLTAIYCPHYCRCTIVNNWKHVSCVGKTLVSVDLDIPKSVEWLQLSHNSIYQIRDFQFWNLQLVSVVELDLSYNQIQQIGLNAFDGMNRLKKIDLSYNHLYHILPYTFENNVQLEVLILQGNPFRYLTRAEALFASNSLSVLDISNSRLNYLHPAAFVSLHNLRHLNISSTGVSLIRPEVLETLDSLKLIDITNTGIKCDEHARALISWALNTTQIIGSPCTKGPKPQEKKFEKMTFFEIQDTLGEFDDEVEECDCDCEVEQLTVAPALFDYETPSQLKRKRFSVYNTEYIIAFLCGIIVGGSVTAAVILTWIYCHKMNSSRRRRNLGNIYVACDVPPPAYGDLFTISHGHD